MANKQDQRLFEFLESKYREFHRIDFIENDPICIPHRFTQKEDIEIAGFITAILAWGIRKTIINKASHLLDLMDNAPYQFILQHSPRDLKKCQSFKHRTFNSDDLHYFIPSLQNIYRNHGGLEQAFYIKEGLSSMERIHRFKKIFFELEHLKRTEKHIADPKKGSTAKRINMYLRWMVRSSAGRVDFGIWNKILPSELMLPLDVHTARVSRSLGLLKRTQNDWQAVEEVSNSLKQFDPNDPIKYDLALFGLGVTAEI